MNNLLASFQGQGTGVSPEHYRLSTAFFLMLEMLNNEYYVHTIDTEVTCT